ncbi:MAG: DUF2520 domain-containing protein [Agathobacter rectalis]
MIAVLTWAILFGGLRLYKAEAVRATGQLGCAISKRTEAGCDGALTGPIERNDIETVKSTSHVCKMTIAMMSDCTKCWYKTSKYC